MRNDRLTVIFFRGFIGLAVLLSASALAVFAQPGGLKGKIRSGSGAAISNAQITVIKGTSEVKSGKTGADGSFQVDGIEPGFYNVRVEADGYASGSLFSVEVKNRVRDLGKLSMRVDQGTQVILRGSVFFKEGTSVTRAKVELEKVNADGTTKEVDSAYSSVSGEFVFRQPPGAAKYRVTAKYNGVTAVKEIEVDNPAVYRLAISLDLSSKDK